VPSHYGVRMPTNNKAIYNLCKNVDYERLKVGNDQQELVRVDNYMQGVDTLVEDAVSRNNFAVADSFYPGIRMDISDAYIVQFVRNFHHIIQDFFKLDLRRIKKAASKYSIVTYSPEKLKLMQRIPHFDAPTRNSLAVIHYLSDAPNSGTSLYRHRETGYEYVDPLRIDNYTQNLQQQFDDPLNQPNGYIHGSTENYEEIASYKAVYNRLLMYRGSSLHSGIINPDYNFDPSPETGRLTVTSFIEFS
jgi:hypothetical protein